MISDPDYREPGYPCDNPYREPYDEESDDDNFIKTHIHLLLSCERKEKCLRKGGYRRCKNWSYCTILEYILERRKEQHEECPATKERRAKKGVDYEPIVYKPRRKEKSALSTYEEVIKENKPKEDFGPTWENTSEETKKRLFQQNI